MPRSKIIIALGLVIALLPLLGFPPSWEAFFQVVAGLSIVGLSVWITIDKKLTQKARAQRRQEHRRAQDRAQNLVLDTQSSIQGEDEPTS